ncbi:hypothetical protein BDV18DRAFT_18323 [Aspergillus unguis]
MDPASSPPPLTEVYPAGVHPPLTADNSNDHSGLVVVLTSFYIVLILAAVSARVFSLYRKRLVQADDYVFALLVVVACAQASVVLGQVHLGWGRRSDLEFDESSGGRWMQMLKVGYAADILSIVALGLSKISTCLFYEALFSQLQKTLIRVLLAVSVVWTILSIILVAVRCTSRPWLDFTTQLCNGLFPRWQAITGLDITTEALLIVYSAWAIHNVRIPLKKQLMVFLALGCRIILIPMSALRLHYLKTQFSAQRAILSGAYATATTEIYLSLSILCQVTSSMKFILAVYEDKNGFAYTDRSGSARSGSGSGSASKSKTAVSSDSQTTSKRRSLSYSLGSLGLGLGLGRRASQGTVEKGRLLKERNSEGHEWKGPSGSRPGTGAGSDGPSGMRILREVQWTVEDEAIELDGSVPRQNTSIDQSLRY